MNNNNLLKDYQLNFIKDFNSITNDSIIITGSFVPKYYGIINRKMKDIDFKIEHQNWETFKDSIYNKFKLKYLFSFTIGVHHIDVYEVTHNRNTFELTVTTEIGFDVISMNGISIKIDTLNNVLNSKHMLIHSYGIDIEKHTNDTLLINQYLNIPIEMSDGPFNNRTKTLI